MKNKIVVVFFLLCCMLNLSAQDIPSRPNPPRLVNDFTGTLTESQISALENKLVATNDSSTVQIAVVMLSTLDGYPISDYAFKLGEQWGIGQKEKNNGALLLISMDEHKLFIAPGYGLEGAMPDAFCKRIVDDDITPFFKQQRYYEGIDAGTTQMMNLARGDYQPTAPKKQKANQRFPFANMLVIAIVIIIFFLSRVHSVRRYSALNSIPFWAAWGLMNAARGRQSGSWRNFNSGSGGFGGGSSGGGGFGGFGGGSFGGGGAGGSW